MADAEDRNLPASARKLQKAREDGQVPRSRDLGHFGAVAAALALLAVMAPRAAAWLSQVLTRGLSFDASMLSQTSSMGDRLAELGAQFAWVMAGLGAAALVVAFATNLAIGGWNWTLKPLAPKFGKLNPIAGLPKLLSFDRLNDTLRACGLALVLMTVGGFYLWRHIEGFAATLGMPLPAALQQAGGDMLQGLALLVLALAVFAGIDVPMQRHQHAKRLKMSHSEAKNERKEQEGNTEVKGRIKQRMREISQRRMLSAVPDADLVVMNPTHYAVALKYDEGSGGAPRVVAKGADLMALRIRDAAKDAKVPVLESPVLARALYAHAELDREIPITLYSAVAQVLAYVYQLRAAMSGRAPMPGDLPDLNVPRELDPHYKPAGA